MPPRISTSIITVPVNLGQGRPRSATIPQPMSGGFTSLYTPCPATSAPISTRTARDAYLVPTPRGDLLKNAPIATAPFPKKRTLAFYPLASRSTILAFSYLRNPLEAGGYRCLFYSTNCREYRFSATHLTREGVPENPPEPPEKRRRVADTSSHPLPPSDRPGSIEVSGAKGFSATGVPA